MKNYLVKLELTIGGFEKHSHILVQAESEKVATAYALYAECHCTDDLAWDGERVEDDGGCMVYQIDECSEVGKRDSAVLERLGFFLMVADKDALRKCGHPDFQ